ncbi:MAG: glycosyl hydrolase 2 galactose-binding domain-containing protein, partial [Chloroflexota bacterium]
MKIILSAAFAALLILVLQGCARNKEYTRGTGVYPGRPSEDFSPELVPGTTYRNIAGMRPVYQSSAYDYNLTSQLLTDGIITDTMPAFIKVFTNEGEVPKNEREWLLDNKRVSWMTVNGSEIFIQFELCGGAVPEPVDKISLTGSVEYIERKPRGWTFTCSGSDDGKNWTELSKFKGYGLPGNERPNPFANFRPRPGTRPMRNPFAGDTTMPRPSFTFTFQPLKPTRVINTSFEFNEPECYHMYRISLSAASADKWTFSDLDFYDNEEKLNMVPSHNFSSSWMSSGNQEEWIYVDLGTASPFDRIKLFWIRKPDNRTILLSEDAQSWKEITSLQDGSSLIDEIIPGKEVEAKSRYVKVLCSGADSNFVLSEIEVYGTGGLIVKPKEGPQIYENRIMLSGGEWKIMRSSLVSDSPEKISMPGYPCSGWFPATVPGTVLTSYKNAGAIPDPNYDDNQLLVSESFFNSDFWYRDEFAVPENFGGKLWLNFDGINWKADVFLNGTSAGRIEGAFIRGKFDVTKLVKPGEKNALAVLIHKNDNIGTVKEQTALSTDKNGGVLGGDNPTFHASVGWDWIPTIRGRNIGIWNDVSLCSSGQVLIEDPFIRTDLPLPDTSFADISIELKLKNTGTERISGQLTGKYGEIELRQEVTLGPSEAQIVRFNSGNHPGLHISNPKLWWPNGYGPQNLYDVTLAFATDGLVSDKVSFSSGIREMSFSEENMTLNMYINGRRFIGRGGNWGFSESNLAYRAREYDAAVAYHADMNFTMIRNWVGQTADDEFFEACDRHGIMVWQDFCLANPADGPDPFDPAMFLKNADDVIKRIRNHPSIAIYVGRNEGNPPRVIDTALMRMVKVLHPGLHYISNSAMGVVSGGGPYRALPVRDYYLLYDYNKFHSERGMPNVMTYESLSQTLRKEHLWPQNNYWGMHDYALESAQACASFNEMVNKGFGPVKDAKEFTDLAQWINYNGYRGMFEGRS